MDIGLRIIEFLDHLDKEKKHYNILTSYPQEKIVFILWISNDIYI